MHPTTVNGRLKDLFTEDLSMSVFSTPTRRNVLAGTIAAAGAIGLAGPFAGRAFAMPASESTGTATGDAIRPFRIDIPETAIADLRQRIMATRWPEKETVVDRSQGAPLASLQELALYWGTGYDWRKVEAKLNGLPQFVTTIDGLDIHFIHVRSPQENALPLILTHGWPGSVIELLETVGPLTDPTAHGGSAEDAFHLVLPSI